MNVARGHHKIFLGMAAGVGKTYRMLQEGHAELEAGRDVVIGYLEPHGRVDTERVAEGLPQLARRRVDYKDVTLSEIFKLVHGIGLATDQLPDRVEQADRLLTIVLDGLRYQR